MDLTSNLANRVPQMAMRGSAYNDPKAVRGAGWNTQGRGSVASNTIAPNAQVPHFSANPLKTAQLNKAFLTGFCEKCAKHGVSPFELIKRAKIDVVENSALSSPVSSTIGRLSTPLYSLVMGSTAPMGANPGKADVDKILKEYGSSLDVKGKDGDTLPLEVQLGSSNPFNNLGRTWQHPNTNILSKLWGTLNWPIGEVLKALGRADSYDPYAHSVALYQKEPGVLRHELGHAKDFAEKDWPGAYAALRQLGITSIPTALYQEAKASGSAGEHLEKSKVSREALIRANQVMSGGFGSYLGGTLTGNPILGGVIGHRVSYPWADPSTKKEYKEPKKKSHKEHKEKAANFDDFRGTVGGGISGALIGALLGMPISDSMYVPTPQERTEAYKRGRPITNLLPGLIGGALVGGGLGAAGGFLADKYAPSHSASNVKLPTSS